MSLIPLMFSNWWEDLDNSHHLYDQHFGLPLSTDELLERTLMVRNPRRLQHLHHNRLHPYESRLLPYEHRLHPYDKSLRMSQQGSGISTLHARKDKYQVNLDLQQFAPNEITVKLVGKNIVVEGKHDFKQDEHGWVSRQFTRKYHIPEQCDIDQIQSQLSSDGILTISVPRKEQLRPDERLIRIQHTNQPANRETGNIENNPNIREQYMYAQKGQMQQQRMIDSKSVKSN